MDYDDGTVRRTGMQFWLGDWFTWRAYLLGVVAGFVAGIVVT